MKPFRLNIKRRLNQKHEEELGTLAAGEVRKARLEELYQATFLTVGGGGGGHIPPPHLSHSILSHGSLAIFISQ